MWLRMVVDLYLSLLHCRDTLRSTACLQSPCLLFYGGLNCLYEQKNQVLDSFEIAKSFSARMYLIKLKLNQDSHWAEGGVGL